MIDALGHEFDAFLWCECGKHWGEHQGTPTKCAIVIHAPEVRCYRRQEINERAKKPEKTLCSKGLHRWSQNNIYTHPRTGHKRCRRCDRIAKVARQGRKNAKSSDESE